MGDAELVAETLAGNSEAYEGLVRRWGTRVLAYCEFRVRDASAADDLSQEALLRAFRSLATLREPAHFGAWLRGIAELCCRDWLRARARRDVTGNDLDTGRQHRETPPIVAAELRDECARLVEQVQALPEELREVVALYYANGFTYAELGLFLGVSPATINARLTQARDLLRKRLSNRSQS